MKTILLYLTLLSKKELKLIAIQNDLKVNTLINKAIIEYIEGLKK